MRSVGVVLTIGLLATACGGEPGAEPVPTTSGHQTTTTTTTSTTTVPSSDVIRVGALGIVVPPDAEGAYPHDLLVGCGAGSFPIGALDEIRPLDEADPGGVAEAIESFLRNEEGRLWPQEGWQILHQTDDRVHLVAKTESGTLAHMYASNDGAGWSWAGASLAGDPCELEFAIPEDLNTVDWRLDPEAEPLTPESTQIRVILSESPCVDGREIGDRLLGPEIVMTAGQVHIAFAAERPEGDAFTCPGNPDTPYVIDLPLPMGDRELIEGLRIGIVLEDYID